jgi:hypothetical protein
MEEVIVDTKQNLQRFVSLIDPPKDLAIPSEDTNKNLSNKNKSHHTIIKRLIFDLFGGTDKFLLDRGISKYKAIGDDKEKLSSRLRSVYRLYFDDKRDKIQVLINGGSPTGYYPMPAGYNIIQDNYSGKCTTNPNYIITPAALIDPCGRKYNQRLLDEGDTLQVIMNFPLTSKILEEAALTTCIDGEIKCEDNGENWKVTIPLVEKLGGPLSLNFSKETLLEENTKYTSGNAKKNAMIYDYINKKPPSRADLLEASKLILLKELGDFLQVLWVLILNEKTVKGAIGKSGPLPNKSTTFSIPNTIVCTSDSVVLYRCILSGIGCIFKEAKTDNATYFLPNVEDDATKLFMQQQTILMIRNEVNTNNMNVIQVLQDIHDLEIQEENYWVGDMRWTPQTVGFAKEFLLKYIEELKNIHADLMVKFNIITNIAIITELAAKSKFQTPFTYKNNRYGLLTNITSLFPKDRTRIFKSSYFTPNSFSRVVYPNPRIQSGGTSWPIITNNRRRFILLALILSVLTVSTVGINRWNPEMFLILVRLIGNIPRHIFLAIAATLGVSAAAVEVADQYFNAGPGVGRQLQNGVALARDILVSPSFRSQCFAATTPRDKKRLAVISETQKIITKLATGESGNVIIDKVIRRVANGNNSQLSTVRAQTATTLTTYINTLLEAEGHMNCADQYYNDSDFLLYYSELAADKMVEAAISIRLYGDYLQKYGLVKTELGVMSPRPTTPPKVLGERVFPKNQDNARKTLIFKNTTKGGTRTPHPILDYPGNMDKPGFLFCYAREMHQELFTYGYYMNLGLGGGIEPSMCTQYLAEEGDYEFMKNGEFVLHVELKDPDALLEKTRERLMYAQVFLKEYPQMIKAESVSNFFEYLEGQSLPEVSPLALQAAMDFYSAYYNIESMATYQKKEHTSYLVERLELLGHYENLLQEDPENELYKFEAEYFYKEAVSIPSVRRAFEKIQEIIQDASAPSSLVKIKRSPMAIAARGGTRKLNKKQGRKTRSRK